jgi:hypothetical protein
MRAEVRYERELLKNVMIDVRLVFGVKTIRDAWTNRSSDGQYEFHVPATPAFPDGIYWHGHAASKYGARALGWEYALRQMQAVARGEEPSLKP